MTATAIGEFRAGAVLNEGFEILVKNIVPFGTISLAVAFPSFLYELSQGAAPVVTTTNTEGGNFYVERSIVGGGALITVAIELLLRQVAVGTISYGVFQEMRGQRASGADCLRRAVSLFFVVAAVAVVAVVATLAAAILLIVPAFIVATMLWVAVPAAVVERPGVFRSLSRSAALTKGHRWQIFGIILLIGIGGLAAGYVVERLFGLGTLGAIVSWVVSAVVSAYAACVTALGYSTLRFAKEGVGVEEIAGVFD